MKSGQADRNGLVPGGFGRGNIVETRQRNPGSTSSPDSSSCSWSQLLLEQVESVNVNRPNPLGIDDPDRGVRPAAKVFIHLVRRRRKPNRLARSLQRAVIGRDVQITPLKSSPSGRHAPCERTRRRAYALFPVHRENRHIPGRHPMPSRVGVRQQRCRPDDTSGFRPSSTIRSHYARQDGRQPALHNFFEQASPAGLQEGINLFPEPCSSVHFSAHRIVPKGHCSESIYHDYRVSNQYAPNHPD